MQGSENEAKNAEERKARTDAIEIHAGRSSLGSEDAPDRYRIQEVREASRPFVVRRRITTAAGV